MWQKLQDKVKSLFMGDSVEEAEETKLTPSTLEQGKSSVNAKMIYQYPKNSSFKFPVIKDELEEEQSVDTPAFLRKENRTQRQQRMLEAREKWEESNSVSAPIKRFKPSRVPSPIYGYHKPDRTKEIEDTPAFIRKEKAQNKEEPVSQSKLERESHEFIEPQISKEQPRQEKKNSVSVAAKELPFVEEVLPKEEPVTEVAEKITEMTNPEDHVKKEKLNRSQRRRNREKRRKERLKKEKEAKIKSTTPVPPVNVIMTPRDKKKLMDKKRAERKALQTKSKKTVERITDYAIPAHLLNDPIKSSQEDRLWVEEQQALLERTLMHFNVAAKVVKATQGPSVTRFEVQPEIGVKVNKIRNLSDDIKLNMAAKDIRIEAPIPGKNAVGIEIPNKESQPVGLQEIFKTEAFQSSESPLTIGLGLTVEGKPLVTNISKMPHGLIAGATGSGKSVCINTILISLIYKSSPEDVKFLLIDPKMVELAPYNGIPHLVAPVITDIKAATAALKWAVQEMENRYEMFVKERVRDIERYNAKMVKEDRHAEKMPFMVIVIDELADLMMMAPQDVEEAICRIAQKARACGMHLLLATQRPSVDVITGLIKANIPTRIAFSVSSQVDSRTIIDANGADRLLGKGDMLFIENGSGESIRLQGPFVSDEEIDRVTNYVRKIAPPNYLFEQEELLTQIEHDEEEDELFHEVLDFILDQGSASTSLVQRSFRIGYNRAARLIDSLENRGIISEQNGSKPREVLLSKTQIEDVI